MVEQAALDNFVRERTDDRPAKVNSAQRQEMFFRTITRYNSTQVIHKVAIINKRCIETFYS